MPAKIYTNESVHVGVAAGLKRRGVNAWSAHDTDFLQLAHAWTSRHKTHWGIIYVHQDKLSVGECIRRLKEIADVFEPDDLQNHIEFL